MIKDDIIAQLSQHIATEILRQPNRFIKPEDPLISSGLIDSFHLVDLALFIEDNFGVHIDDTELNQNSFDTLDQLSSLINSRQG